MRGFGVEVSFGGARDVLPMSLTIGAYLLDAAGWTGTRKYVAIYEHAAADDAAMIGSTLTDDDTDVALLVIGDGSAKRSLASPGYFDERASTFDAAVVAALSGPDPAVLLSLDPALSDELWVAGRVAWQALAGAARTTYQQHTGSTISASVRYDEAPYGVGYFVVDWAVSVP